MNKYMSLLTLTALCSASAGFASDDTVGTTKMLPNDLAAARAIESLDSAPPEIRDLITSRRLNPFSEETAKEIFNTYDFLNHGSIFIVKDSIIISGEKVSAIDVFPKDAEGVDAGPSFVTYLKDFPEGYFHATTTSLNPPFKRNFKIIGRYKWIVNIHTPVA